MTDPLSPTGGAGEPTADIPPPMDAPPEQGGLPLTETTPPTVPSAGRRGWWRRNRWALLALPVVLVVVAASGAGRAATFWLPNELSDRVDTQFDTMTHFADDYVDATGEHQRSLKIAVRDVVADPQPLDMAGEPVTGGLGGEEPATAQDLLPQGTRLWQVDLDFEADPETVLTICHVALVDAQGRITERDTSLLSWNAGFDVCQPANTQNPTSQLFVDEEAHEPSTRPPAYSRSVQLVTADNFEPVAVRVWWEPPTYLSVRLPADAP